MTTSIENGSIVGGYTDENGSREHLLSSLATSQAKIWLSLRRHTDRRGATSDALINRFKPVFKISRFGRCCSEGPLSVTFNTNVNANHRRLPFG
jgi:hypothetical protein